MQNAKPVNFPSNAGANLTKGKHMKNPKYKTRADVSYNTEQLYQEQELIHPDEVSVDIDARAKKCLSFTSQHIENTTEIVIDRDQEDADVLEYQKTGDMDLLTKLYRNRIPTLKAWSQKHFYPGLCSSIDDLFSELSIVFVKAVENYKTRYGVAFNTCLFRFLLNRVKNIKSSVHAKKRKSDEYNGPASGMVLSLDYAYGDSDSELKLQDVIASNRPEDIPSHGLDDLLTNWSGNNNAVKDFLYKVSSGESVTALIRDAKRKDGELHITPSQRRLLEKRRNKDMVKKMIIEQQCYDQKFSVLDYELDNNSVKYCVELRHTPESDLLTKTVKHLRENKEVLVSQLAQKH